MYYYHPSASTELCKSHYILYWNIFSSILLRNVILCFQARRGLFKALFSFLQNLLWNVHMSVPDIKVSSGTCFLSERIQAAYIESFLEIYSNNQVKNIKLLNQVIVVSSCSSNGLLTSSQFSNATSLHALPLLLLRPFLPCLLRLNLSGSDGPLPSPLTPWFGPRTMVVRLCLSFSTSLTNLSPSLQFPHSLSLSFSIYSSHSLSQ